MEQKFGDKYINPRKILVEYAKQRVDQITTEDNKKRISKGMNTKLTFGDNNGLLRNYRLQGHW